MSGMPAFDGRGAGRWQSYAVPVSGWTVGASVITGRWTRTSGPFGDKGEYRIKVILGPGFSIGVGATFGLPFTLAAESQSAGADFRMEDLGSQNYKFIAHQNAATVSLWGAGANGAYSVSWPFTPASGDLLYLAGGGEIQS